MSEKPYISHASITKVEMKLGSTEQPGKHGKIMANVTKSQSKKKKQDLQRLGLELKQDKKLHRTLN